jgi:FemAB-related protein (PEP-CTERM system-associated)
MNIRSANPVDHAGISGFLARFEQSTLYHDYLWMDIIKETFGHDYYYLICEDVNNSIVGVLPLVHMKSIIFGNFMVSVPYFNYGGVCAENTDIREMLVRSGIEIARKVGASHIELRQQEPLGNGMPVKTKKVSMRLPLVRDPEELMNSFPSKLRSQIRGTIKRDLNAHIGKHDELENFYKIFSINMKELGTPVYPKIFFKKILDKFYEKAWIVTIYLQNVPMASGFLIAYKDIMEIPWASSIKKFNRLSPNMLLYWSCLEFACENGYSVFDFGRSTFGESTYKFKQQWGATPFQLNWHYWMRDGDQLPEISPANSRYQLAIKIWKRLPLPVTRIVGPRIVKNIP